MPVSQRLGEVMSLALEGISGERASIKLGGAPTHNTIHRMKRGVYGEPWTLEAVARGYSDRFTEHFGDEIERVTGARVSELCGLKRSDFDFLTRRCVVRGKGGHERALHLGTVSARALWAYVNEARQAPEAALFLGDRGTRAGEGLRRKGVQELFWRLEKAAGLSGVRCSPHTMRHSFSIRFLKAGGNQFQLMSALGHTSVGMTARYVALAQIDGEAAQKSFSPADRLRRGM